MTRNEEIAQAQKEINIYSRKTVSQRFNKTTITMVDWDRYHCFIYDADWQGFFLFATVSSSEAADQRCADRQGLTLDQYYQYIRDDYATAHLRAA
jgi:hypothetical protein